MKAVSRENFHGADRRNFQLSHNLSRWSQQHLIISVPVKISYRFVYAHFVVSDAVSLIQRNSCVKFAQIKNRRKKKYTNTLFHSLFYFCHTRTPYIITCTPLNNNIVFPLHSSHNFKIFGVQIITSLFTFVAGFYITFNSHVDIVYVTWNRCGSRRETANGFSSFNIAVADDAVFLLPAWVLQLSAWVVCFDFVVWSTPSPDYGS